MQGREPGPTHKCATGSNTGANPSIPLPGAAAGGKISAEVCSQCHPFYTGKQKILDTGGRVAKFEARFGGKKSGK